MSRPVVVAGAHRSGTSLTMQLLVRAGLFPGDDLVAAGPGNPYGHVEDRLVYDIHERVLADNGLDWRVDRAGELDVSVERRREMDDFASLRRGQSGPWGFKDPRVCFVLGTWKQVLPDAVLLVVFRDPAECVGSLLRRHAANIARDQRFSRTLDRAVVSDPDRALRMWTAANEQVLDVVEEHREDAVVVPLAAVLAGFDLPGMLRQRFGVELASVPADDVVDRRLARPVVRPQPLRSLAARRDAARVHARLWDAADTEEPG